MFESLWFTLSVYLRLLSVRTYFVLFLFILNSDLSTYQFVLGQGLFILILDQIKREIVESRVKLLHKFNALVLLCFFQMLMSVRMRMVGVVTTAATQSAPTAVPVCLDTHSTPLIMRHVMVNKQFC